MTYTQITNKVAQQTPDIEQVFDMTNMRRPPAQHEAMDWASVSGAVPIGSHILTLDGSLPVDHLYPGDRIITRAGARRLATVTRIELSADTEIVRMTRNALGGRPDRDLCLLPGQMIRVSDWRAQALWDVADAVVPVSKLVDGDYIRHGTTSAGDAMIHLSFDTEEIIYVDGLEVVAAATQPFTVTA
ncbi:MAG: Hint domain-containing protein [Pseudomonadota bacterium]